MFTYPSNEFVEVSFNNGLHDSSVHISQPNAHLCSQYEQEGKNDKVLCLLARIARYRYLEEMLDLLPKLGINISGASLYLRLKNGATYQFVLLWLHSFAQALVA